MKNKKILVIGSIFVDIILDIDKIPKSGADVYADMKSISLGGSAYNVYRSINYLNGNSKLLAPLGNGNYANIIKTNLEDSGCNILVQDNSADNGWDISLVESDGERTFLTIGGIEQTWKHEWFDKIDMSDFDYIYLSGYELENQHNSDLICSELDKVKLGAKILFDTSPRLKYLSHKTLNNIIKPGTIVHCNFDEINTLSKSRDHYKIAAQQIFDHTSEPVLVTLGSKGTYFVSDDDSGIIPGEKVELINTIGAGDNHCGAFLDGLSKDKSVRDSIVQANHISALVVQQQEGAL